MVRENRIKNYTFEQFSVTGSNFSYSSESPLNGEILKVRVQNITSPGSMFINDDDITVWSRLSLTSGLSTFEVYPVVYPVNELNTTGSPLVITNRVTNNIISLTGSGFTSGT